MYGKNYYGQFLYGSEGEPIEKPDVDERTPDLMKYLPYYYQKSKIVADIQKSIAEQIGLRHYLVDDIQKQMNVSTATWGLDVYEKELGIPTNTALPLRERREIITAKIRGRGTTTKKMIQNTAESFAGGEVDVIEITDKYHFIVKFVGIKGIPSNLKGFVNMLEEIKPAHLTYELQYTYTVWDEIAELRWSQTKMYTWGEIQEVQDFNKGV